MSGKTVLITGGNTGIGKHTVLGLARMGAKVIFTSRNQRKGDVARAELRELSGNKQVDFMDLDLASFASIRAMAEAFQARHERLDVLVLNAGLILDRRTTTEEGFETTFGVNHLGHFLLTKLLWDMLVASAPARVVVVASAAHQFARDGLDLDDLQSERGYRGFEVYGRSKLANILFCRELARRLEGTGVTANSLHPGTVRTEFGAGGDLGSPLLQVMMALGRPFFISAARGAKTSLHLASAPELEGQSGGYYVRCKPKQPNAYGRDDETAAKLWAISEELIAQASNE